MNKFIALNTNYLKDAMEKGPEGKVAVHFIVNREGALTKSSVVKGISKNLDAEALRMVEAMPNWVPGKQNGRTISVQMAIPVIFRLPREEQKNVNGCPASPQEKTKGIHPLDARGDEHTMRYGSLNALRKINLKR